MHFDVYFTLFTARVVPKLGGYQGMSNYVLRRRNIDTQTIPTV